MHLFMSRLQIRNVGVFITLRCHDLFYEVRIALLPMGIKTLRLIMSVAVPFGRTTTDEEFIFETPIKTNR